jgi:hypothetical protein
MIASNPFLGRLLTGTNTAQLKVCGDCKLYIRGANLTEKKDVGYEESTRLKGITVDAVYWDELDIMDEDVIEKAKGRMGDSKVGEEIYIGNPGVPRKGIDAIFQASDQRHWWMFCKKCHTSTCAEFQFFEDPSFIKEKDDGTSYLGCRKCGARIDNATGYWKADVPTNSEHMHGYRWSQLITPSGNSPAEILHAFRFPPNDNVGDVYRLMLGMPYISSSNELSQVAVRNCCGTFPILHSDAGPCVMGVDQGDIKHYIIGAKAGKETFIVLKVGKTDSWTYLHDIARCFNVRHAVVDLQPNADSARDFQAKSTFKTWLCQYSENTPAGTMFNENTGIVRINRTEIFDKSAKVFRQQRVEIPRLSPEIKEFIQQMTDPVCVEEKDKKTGRLVRRYRGKNDHYRNAMNYFLMASEHSRIRRDSWLEEMRPTRVKNEYARI